MRPAVFLDRDGTIIEDLHYPREAHRVSLLPKAVEGLKLMVEKGYWLFVISNQSGVGRGIISKEEFEAVHAKTVSLLGDQGVRIEDYAYCFSADNACPERKPNPGMIPKKHGGHPLDWRASFVVGDRETDLELGTNIGARSYLVLTGKGKDTLKMIKSEEVEPPFRVCKDLLEVANDLPAVGH